MRLEQVRLWWHAREPWEKRAIVVWLVVLLAISGRLLLWPHKSPGVYPIFANAARSWWEGAELYFWDYHIVVYDHYRYSPLVAASLSPLAVLPERLGAVTWRLFNTGIYLAAMAWWSQAVLCPPLTRRQMAL